MVGLSSTGVFLSSVAIQAIGFIANFFLYHRIATSNAGSALLGTVQLYLLIASSINGMGDLRIGTAYTFFIARGQSPKNSTATYLTLRLAMVGGAGIALFLLGTLGGSSYSWASTREEYFALALFMGLPILWSIQTVYTQLAIAQGRSTAGQIPLLLESVIRTPLLIYAVYYSPTIEGLTLAYLPGAIVSAAYSFLPVARELAKVARAEAVRMFRYAWPLMGSLVLLYIANNAPPLLVNAFAGTAALPQFNAANAWRILALTLPTAVATPLFPFLSGLHRNRDYEGLRRSTWKALRYTAMIVFPGVMVAIIYRVNLLNTINGGFLASDPDVPIALALLAASVVPAALSQIIGTSLNAIGYQRLELYLTSLQVGVLFAASVLFLPPVALFRLDPVVAVSIALVASSVAALVLNTYFMERLLAVRIQLRPVAAILGSAAVAFYAVSQFNLFITHNRYYELALGIVLGFVVYFLVLALVGDLTKEDVRYLVSSVGLPRPIGNFLARFCWRTESPAVNIARPGAAEGLNQKAIERLERTHELERKP